MTRIYKLLCAKSADTEPLFDQPNWWRVLSWEDLIDHICHTSNYAHRRRLIPLLAEYGINNRMCRPDELIPFLLPVVGVRDLLATQPLSMQARPSVANLKMLIEYYNIGRRRWANDDPTAFDSAEELESALTRPLSAFTTADAKWSTAFNPQIDDDALTYLVHQGVRRIHWRATRYLENEHPTTLFEYTGTERPLCSTTLIPRDQERWYEYLMSAESRHLSGEISASFVITQSCAH